MRTTIEIAEPLHDEVKRLASRQGTTLRSLVEEGLRLVLAQRALPAKAFKLRRASFRGKGLQPGVARDVLCALGCEGDPQVGKSPKFGKMRGKIRLAEDFDRPLDDFAGMLRRKPLAKRSRATKPSSA